jgi:hypothetical protein
MRDGHLVLVRCLHCRHKSVLNQQMLAGFGLKPDVPIAALVTINKSTTRSRSGMRSRDKKPLARIEARAGEYYSRGPPCPRKCSHRVLRPI